jgi:tetratricopeptide (TPR) repeat protein
MRAAYLIIGIVGLNICLLQGQEQLWEQHLLAGRNLRAQALYKEAEQEYLAAVRAAEAFGAEDPRLAKSWNNVAAVYQDQGRYSEAESLYRKAAAVWERTQEQADLAACLNNLAAIERLLGRNRESEALYLRSIAIRERALPPAHPDLAITWNNLGELYLTLGRYEEAEAFIRRALDAREKTLGPDHKDLAPMLGNLGLLFRAVGR